MKRKKRKTMIFIKGEHLYRTCETVVLVAVGYWSVISG